MGPAVQQRPQVTLWVDAQLPPAIAAWIQDHWALPALTVRDLGLREATDEEIFFAARAQEVTVMTKDRDFVALVERLGPPPQVIWLTCGNTSNVRLRQILTTTLDAALTLVRAGEPLIEITGD